MESGFLFFFIERIHPLNKSVDTGIKTKLYIVPVTPLMSKNKETYIYI